MISTITRKISASSRLENALLAIEAGIIVFLLHIFAAKIDSFWLIVMIRIFEGLALFATLILVIYLSLDLLDNLGSTKVTKRVTAANNVKRISFPKYVYPRINFSSLKMFAGELKTLAVMIVGSLIFAWLLTMVPWDSITLSTEGVFREDDKVVSQSTAQIKIVKQPVSKSHYKYDRLIVETCKRHKMDPDLIKAIIHTESRFNTYAVSPRRATGLMQFMPDTAREWNVHNRTDPASNIDGGVRYFKFLLYKYNGSVQLALAAYNAGEGNVKKYNGIPPFRETREYIPSVLSRYQYYKKHEPLAPQMVELPNTRVVEQSFLEKLKNFFSSSANAG